MQLSCKMRLENIFPIKRIDFLGALSLGAGIIEMGREYSQTEEYSRVGLTLVGAGLGAIAYHFFRKRN